MTIVRAAAVITATIAVLAFGFSAKAANVVDERASIKRSPVPALKPVTVSAVRPGKISPHRF